MRFGLKLWSSNADMLADAVGLISPDRFQYIELTPIPGTEVAPWVEHDAPFIIHATTERHGLNIADPSKREFNRILVERSLEWADALDAEFVVLHPGYGKLDDALAFLEGVEDPRILVENMPRVGLGGEPMVGSDPGQIEKLMEHAARFCLDVNHAMKAAASMGMDGLELVRSLDSLGPRMYHIADGFTSNAKDEHLNLGQGDYDLAGILSIIGGSDMPITLETPRKSFGCDLENLASLKGLLPRIAQKD